MYAPKIDRSPKYEIYSKKEYFTQSKFVSSSRIIVDNNKNEEGPSIARNYEARDSNRIFSRSRPMMTPQAMPKMLKFRFDDEALKMRKKASMKNDDSSS